MVGRKSKVAQEMRRTESREPALPGLRFSLSGLGPRRVSLPRMSLPSCFRPGMICSWTRYFQRSCG